jgi:hypothetical protein
MTHPKQRQYIPTLLSPWQKNPVSQVAPEHHPMIIQPTSHLHILFP